MRISYSSMSPRVAISITHSSDLAWYCIKFSIGIEKVALEPFMPIVKFRGIDTSAQSPGIQQSFLLVSFEHVRLELNVLSMPSIRSLSFYGTPM